jgi:hypothetical protein
MRELIHIEILKGHSHEKICDIIPLNHRLGKPTLSEISNSPVALLRIFK